MNMDGICVLGFDTESTGLDPRRHVTIEVGVTVRGPDGFDVYASPIWHAPGSFLWEYDAFVVNGANAMMVSDPDLEDRLPEVVDAEVAAFIEKAADGRRPLACGWNCGSFDLKFAEVWLPNTAKMLGYHTIDLNAVMYAMGAAGRACPTKAELKALVEERHGEDYDANWHSAGWDSLTHLAIFEELTRLIAECA